MLTVRPAQVFAMFSSLAVTAIAAGALTQEKDTPAADSGMIVTLTRAGQASTAITIARLGLTRAVTTCHNSGMGQKCENPTTESAKAKLKADDVQKLSDGIRSSGFLELEEHYGTRGFSYPKTITVKLDGRTKNVVYRSGSGAAPAPDAFVSVEKMIEELASKALPSDPAKTPSPHRDPKQGMIVHHR